MIYLYYKDKLEKVKWTSKYDYLVTRSGMLYYFGKIPERVKTDYLTREGVELTRVFMQRLHSGDFGFKVVVEEGLQKCYWFYLSFDSTNWYEFLHKCSMHKITYIESYWFKHIVKGVVRHYIGEGEGIAGVLLSGDRFKLINREMPVMYIDISYTYLTVAFDDVGRFMKRKKWVKSVTWINRQITAVNDEPVKEIKREFK